MYSAGSSLIYLQQRFLRLARGLEACPWSTVPMAMFRELCFWELSYVNVPTVNLKSYSMHAAIRTRYVIPPHLFNSTALLVRTTCASFWI